MSDWADVPAKQSSRRDYQLHIPLDPVVLDKFKAKCKAKNQSMAFVVRTWIEKAVAQN